MDLDEAQDQRLGLWLGARSRLHALCVGIGLGKSVAKVSGNEEEPRELAPL